jgi:hypothetical protein
MVSSSERARMARENAHWAHVSRAWCDYRPSALSAMELAFHTYEVDPASYEACWREERPAGAARRAVSWLFGWIRSGVGRAVAIAVAQVGRLGKRRPGLTGAARPVGSMH